MTKFTITFKDGETRTISATYIEPEFLKGWWSFDPEGKEVYHYGEEKKSIPLGKTMYFHVELKGIAIGKEVEFQLFDYDELFWQDVLDPDDDTFPNDPVHKKATINYIDGKRIASIEVKLEEDWEPVIYDDHKGYVGSVDQTIELYWKVSYGRVSAEFPKDKDHDRLRVGYNDRDLYVIPVDEGSSIPEFYDSDGKLIILGVNIANKAVSDDDMQEGNERSEHYDKKGKMIRYAYKRANDIAKSTGLEGKIDNIVITKIRITTASNYISEINAIKKSIYRQEINMTTNEITKTIGYEVEKASNFIFNDTFSTLTISETEEMTRKKFSEYFTRKDIAEGTVGALRNGRELLRFYDYVQVGNTIHSLFPQDGNTGIPKPSSVVSIFTTFSGAKDVALNMTAKKIIKEEASKKALQTLTETTAGSVTSEAAKSAAAKEAAKLHPAVLASEALSGLGALFMVADVITTETVNGMLNEMGQYGSDIIQLNKHKGLRTLERLMNETYVDELSNYFLEYDVSQEAHEKVLIGDIKTIQELRNYSSLEGSGNTYTYLIQTIGEEETEKHLIDAIYVE